MAQYVMFVDESGDHNLQNIDDNFPLFCLCGCIFKTGAQLSFDVLRAKICHKPGQASRILGYGIKIFPQATFDHYLYLDGGF